MKKLFAILFISFWALLSYAQTSIPQLVSFSAVVRDANNQPLVNTPVSIRLTFKEGGQNGPLVYCALHQTTTNQNGFMSLLLNRDVLGTGCNGAPSTAFQNIPWENGGFWMEVEYQTIPGSPFINLGQLELASSFYAFAAGTAERIAGFDLSGANNGDVLTYNITTQQWEAMPPNSGTGFSGDYNDLSNLPDLSVINTDNQQISVSATGDTLYLQNGGFVIIPGISSANTPAQLPSLTTNNASSITGTTAVSGGVISSNGGANITARGIVWSTTASPTLYNNLGSTINGSGIGSFTSNLSNLATNMTYYVRAYAINSAGTAYGNQQIFTTINSGGIVSNPGAGVTYNGSSYSSIVLGNGQEWLTENLRTSQYNDGTPITLVTDQNYWVANGSNGSTLPMMCWYNNDQTTNTANAFGAMYNWYAVSPTTNGNRNVCPTGWHVPSDAEWTVLIDYLGGESMAGGKMKSTGTQYWTSPNSYATNESGFSCLPGGGRWDSGNFGDVGEYGYWWSSTLSNTGGSAWIRYLSYNDGLVNRILNYEYAGYSVRCLRD